MHGAGQGWGGGGQSGWARSVSQEWIGVGHTTADVADIEGLGVEN